MSTSKFCTTSPVVRRIMPPPAGRAAKLGPKVTSSPELASGTAAPVASWPCDESPTGTPTDASPPKPMRWWLKR